MVALDAVGGDLDLGLGVDALGRAGHVILADLVEVAAETAELGLEELGGEDDDARAVEPELDAELRGLELEDVVDGAEDGADLLTVSLDGPLGVGGNLELLVVDGDLDFGVLAALLLGRGEEDGVLAEEDLDLAPVLVVLHAPGQDAVGALVGAISGEEVEAVVHLEGHGLVVEGGEHLRANLALGGPGLAGQRLQDLVEAVGASGGLHGEDEAEGVGDADLGEDDGLLGLVDDQVEAGGLAVEKNANHDGEAGLLLLEHVLVQPAVAAAGALDGLDVGPEEDLEVLDSLLLDDQDLNGNVAVLDLVLDLVDGLGLEAGALASVGQLGAGDAVLKKLVALPGLGGLAAELLLFVRDLGAADGLDGGLGAGGLAEADVVDEAEVNEARSELLNVPEGQDGHVDLSLDAELLDGRRSGSLALEVDVPLVLDHSVAAAVRLLTSGEGDAVGEGPRARSLHGEGVDEAEGIAGLNVELLEGLLDLLLAARVDTLLLVVVVNDLEGVQPVELVLLLLLLLLLVLEL